MSEEREVVWYSGVVATVGWLFIVFGAQFFIFAGNAGVPVIPWSGLVLTVLGIWMIRGRKGPRSASATGGSAPKPDDQCSR